MIGSLPPDLPLCASGRFFVWILLLITQKENRAKQPDNGTAALPACLLALHFVCCITRNASQHLIAVPSCPAAGAGAGAGDANLI